MARPPVFDRLHAALVSAGYVADGPVPSGGFGDETWIFNGRRVRIRAASDRGDWSLQLAPNSEPDWFTVGVWRSCLDGLEPSVDEEPFGRQAEFVIENLGRLDELLAGGGREAALIQCLYSARDKRGELLEQLFFGPHRPRG